ncbi:MAG: hypothetical protein QM765_29725 [Myxococcales bacterium]
MAIAAVVLTLVGDAEGRASALSTLADWPGLTLVQRDGAPRVGAVLEAADEELEPRFGSLREVPGVLQVALAGAWLGEGNDDPSMGSER